MLKRLPIQSLASAVQKSPPKQTSANRSNRRRRTCSNKGETSSSDVEFAPQVKPKKKAQPPKTKAPKEKKRSKSSDKAAPPKRPTKAKSKGHSSLSSDASLDPTATPSFVGRPKTVRDTQQLLRRVYEAKNANPMEDEAAATADFFRGSGTIAAMVYFALQLIPSDGSKLNLNCLHLGQRNPSRLLRRKRRQLEHPYHWKRIESHVVESISHQLSSRRLRCRHIRRWRCAARRIAQRQGFH